MTILVFLSLALVGFAVGVTGAFFGIGGGFIIIPALVLGFGATMHNAVATSLITIIATSSAVTGFKIKEGLVNLRLGALLDLPTVAGAITGAVAASAINDAALKRMFCVLLLAVSASMFKKALIRRPARQSAPQAEAGPPAAGELAGKIYDHHTRSWQAYEVKRFPLIAAGAFGAGCISGLLGIGGGIVKVPLMHLVGGVPLKAATATSNFMIGITAAASAIVYYRKGLVLPEFTAVIVLGVILGALAGMKWALKIKEEYLQLAFAVLLLGIAARMFLS